MSVNTITDKNGHKTGWNFGKAVSVVFMHLCVGLCIIWCVFNLSACSKKSNGEVTASPEPSSEQVSVEAQQSATENEVSGNTVQNISDAKEENRDEKIVDVVDLASELKLDINSETLKQEVTVKAFIDGDTTHFFVPGNVVESGVLKARYLAINTPESTGKIEEYGKKASNFTKEKLSKATSIIIESDDANWNVDSTGSRYLVWVWYRTDETSDYRNLNLEILQNGLAIASSSANNRYGDTCVKAIANAKAAKLNIYSGQKDPDFYYGEAIELTLKELRTNIEAYSGAKVAFEGVTTRNGSNSVYVEEYDSETDRYYGIMVYYGFSLAGEGLDILSVGNRVRVVGSLQYYENGGTYQISGLTYRQMKPKDPNNIQKLGDGYKPAYTEFDPYEFAYGAVSYETEEGDIKFFKVAELAMDTSVSMKNLDVLSIYTTSNEESSSFGAMTLTCDADDAEIVVRTDVLYDSDGNLITESAYRGKNINVRGIVDFYDGNYQIKVLSAEDITIN